MAEPISFNLRVAVREGQLEPLKKLRQELVAATETEPGTLAYEWFLGEDGTTCHIYERYADAAALKTHLESFGRFAARFHDCVEPTALEVYGDPVAEAREALEGFGAVYLGSFGGFSRKTAPAAAADAFRTGAWIGGMNAIVQLALPLLDRARDQDVEYVFDLVWRTLDGVAPDAEMLQSEDVAWASEWAQKLRESRHETHRHRGLLEGFGAAWRKFAERIADRTFGDP